MTEWQGELLAALITALTALFAMVARRLDVWLASKIENENVERMTRRLNAVIWDVVLELQQTQVDELKVATDPDSPGGRKITPVEAERWSTVRTNKDAFTRSALEGGKPGTRAFGELLTTEGDKS